MGSGDKETGQDVEKVGQELTDAMWCLNAFIQPLHTWFFVIRKGHKQQVFNVSLVISVLNGLAAHSSSTSFDPLNVKSSLYWYIS